MYFFFFDQPKQIKNIKIESLSQFVKLLRMDSELYLETTNFLTDRFADEYNERDVIQQNTVSFIEGFLTKSIYLYHQFIGIIISNMRIHILMKSG